MVDTALLELTSAVHHFRRGVSDATPCMVGRKSFAALVVLVADVQEHRLVVGPASILT
jgi:hypothetical protein